MSDKQAGVYILHNLNNDKLYVGSTKDLEKRKKDHFGALCNNKHRNPKLQNAFNKDHNFDFIAQPCETRDEAFDAEQEIIDEHWGNPLFLNLAKDARCVFIDCPPEIREKIRQSRLEYRASDETRAKISQSLIGNTRCLGNKASEETKTKMSISHIGFKHTEEVKEICRQTNLGRIRSAEHNAKVGLANSRSVQINDLTYVSINAAAEALGLHRNTIRKKLDSDKYSNFIRKVDDI